MLLVLSFASFSPQWHDFAFDSIESQILEVGNEMVQDGLN